MSYTAAVITISDKGARGERVDTSGPALCALLKNTGWEIAYSTIIPDDSEKIQDELIKCADELKINLILTTGGTGFSPRDVTPEATLKVIKRRAPGIPEAMRAESMRITPRGCLSREEAGIRGRSLIINLPGSEKAALENLQAVLGPIAHGVEILLGNGSADCGQAPGFSGHSGQADGGAVLRGGGSAKQEAPSTDQWIREAKAEPYASKIGMYLIHKGAVRSTAKARVRGGDESAAPVTGMQFSYDAKKVEEAIRNARKMPGIYHIRVWLNEGRLNVGDDLMQVLIGGDIRPHVLTALQSLVGQIKTECVCEHELHEIEQTK